MQNQYFKIHKECSSDQERATHVSARCHSGEEQLRTRKKCTSKMRVEGTQEKKRLNKITEVLDLVAYLCPGNPTCTDNYYHKNCSENDTVLGSSHSGKGVT